MTKGFTIIELLIVIAIIGVLAYVSLPMGLTFFRSQNVSSAREQLVELLNRARHNAILQKNDSAYGVYIDTMNGDLTSFTLYRGAAYGDNPSDDEVYEQAPNLTISTGDSSLVSGEINFSKLTGMPSATGTITIKNVNGGSNENRSVTIDYFGNATKN